MEVESKLTPALREAVMIIKMILFKELKGYAAQAYPDEDGADICRLCGAVVNSVFGAMNQEEPFASFAYKNQARIESIINSIPKSFESLRIPLTDALRIQFLCDNREGINSEHVLQYAQKTGILILDREVPLPKTFMNLVRTLGAAYHILEPMKEEPDFVF